MHTVACSHTYMNKGTASPIKMFAESYPGTSSFRDAKGSPGAAVLARPPEPTANLGLGLAGVPETVLT